MKHIILGLSVATFIVASVNLRLRGGRHLVETASAHVIVLNPQDVPEHLRDLIPMAEKWGNADEIICLDVEAKASPEEKEEFTRRLRGRIDQINEWLDSFQDEELTDAGISFMYMTLALDEMGLWPD